MSLHQVRLHVEGPAAVRARLLPSRQLEVAKRSVGEIVSNIRIFYLKLHDITSISRRREVANFTHYCLAVAVYGLLVLAEAEKAVSLLLQLFVCEICG